MLTEPDRTRPAGDDGFSMVELIVTVSITIVMMLAFVIFMTMFITKDRVLHNEATAVDYLQTEYERLNVIPFKDLMIPPAGWDGTPCDLEGTRGKSLQSVASGPDKVIVSGLELQVTRTVTWQDGTTAVTCSGVKDKDELKRVSVTVQWADEKGGLSSRTLATFRGESTEHS